MRKKFDVFEFVQCQLEILQQEIHGFNGQEIKHVLVGSFFELANLTDLLGVQMGLILAEVPDGVRFHIQIEHEVILKHLSGIQRKILEFLKSSMNGSYDQMSSTFEIATSLSTFVELFTAFKESLKFVCNESPLNLVPYFRRAEG